MVVTKARVAIIGYGYVGISIAVGLAKQGIDVVIIDNTIAPLNIPYLSGRLFALSLSSEDFYTNNDIDINWNKISQPISKIKVYEGDSLDFLSFDPSDINRDHFGYMIEEQVLLKELKEQVSKAKILVLQSQVLDVLDISPFAHIKLNNNDIVRAELVIVADGKNSKIRNMIGMESYKKEYGQIAITFDIEHEFDHGGCAIERFMPSGPFAILPKLGGNKSSIVWTESSETKDFFNDIDDTLLNDLLQRRISEALGDFSIISKPMIFPLSLIYSESVYSGRIVLAGDALHSIHPLAGQGLNLGLRDAAAIVKLISQDLELGLDLGNRRLLIEYQNARLADIHLLITATNTLNSLFANQLPFMSTIRELGLQSVDIIKPLKKFFTKYAVGYGAIQ